jgi:hypothetical protein
VQGKNITWFLILGFDSLICTKLGGIAESLVNRGKLALLHYEPISMLKAPVYTMKEWIDILDPLKHVFAPKNSLKAEA